MTWTPGILCVVDNSRAQKKLRLSLTNGEVRYYEGNCLMLITNEHNEASLFNTLDLI